MVTFLAEQNPMHFLEGMHGMWLLDVQSVKQPLRVVTQDFVVQGPAVYKAGARGCQRDA